LHGLEQVQVVTSLHSEDMAKGRLHEKIYDPAWNANHQPSAYRKLPAVGDSADVANATRSMPPTW
jgi:hypothetical protein